MTFGMLKSIIEENLVSSYKDSESFKKVIKEFKHNILNDKKISKIYSIYDDLYSQKGLSVEDAKEYLSESLSLIRHLLQSVKLPKNLLESKVPNKYELVDSLIYVDPISTNISERIEVKKKILNTLTSSPNIKENTISIPISSMVRIANQTLNSYIENLDESSKKEFLEIIKEDSKSLEVKFETLKESAISKLSPILDSENDSDTKSKIEDTIRKIKEDKFDQINYLKLKSLVSSI
jgi:hypothetical protein